jgi:hypothetical protein
MSNQKAFQRMQTGDEMLREIVQYEGEYITMDTLYHIFRNEIGRVLSIDPVVNYVWQDNNVVEGYTFTARGVSYSDIQPRRSSVDGE